jgi:opacity protein-like surface antigen
MKRLLLCAAIIALTSHLAVGQVSFGGGGQLGISIAMFPDPLKDYYGMGLGFGGHGDVNLMKYVTLRLNVDYYTFGFDTKKLADLIAQQSNLPSGAITMEGLRSNDIAITINGIGKIPLQGMVTPYGILGFGLNMMSASDPKVTYQGQDVTGQAGLGKTESVTKFGLNFGAGSEFQVGKLKLFFEVKYCIVFTEIKNTSHLPITIGVTF